jgi:hypothetical protein
VAPFWNGAGDVPPAITVPASTGRWSTCNNLTTYSSTAAGPARCKWLVPIPVTRAGSYSVSVLHSSGIAVPVLGYNDRLGTRWARLSCCGQTILPGDLGQA